VVWQSGLHVMLCGCNEPYDAGLEAGEEHDNWRGIGQVRCVGEMSRGAGSPGWGSRALVGRDSEFRMLRGREKPTQNFGEFFGGLPGASPQPPGGHQQVLPHVSRRCAFQPVNVGVGMLAQPGRSDHGSGFPARELKISKNQCGEDGKRVVKFTRHAPISSLMTVPPNWLSCLNRPA
jgi:hypothetical protein